MMQARICPNFVTLIGVLSSCGHAGLADKGCKYFNLISVQYGVITGVEHFAFIVHILGHVDAAQCGGGEKATNYLEAL